MNVVSLTSINTTITIGGVTEILCYSYPRTWWTTLGWRATLGSEFRMLSYVQPLETTRTLANFITAYKIPDFFASNGTKKGLPSQRILRLTDITITKESLAAKYAAMYTNTDKEYAHPIWHTSHP